MKSRLYAILTLFVLFLSVSCGRHKGEFVLRGTVQDGIDTILVVGIDNRFENIDTIFCNEGQFKWSFRPDTVTSLILVLPDGRYHPVFAEKDVQSSIFIPADTGLINISGGYCNDSYQLYHMNSLNDTTIELAIAHIDSFITKDPFSEVSPYLIYEQLVQKFHADESTITKEINRMSGNMQDAPFLVALKSEFIGQLSNNTYLSSLSINDSLGESYQFTDVGGSSNHVLACIWATWTGDEGIQARREMDSVRIRFSERKLYVTDISVDANVERWKKAIEKDTLDWLSYIDSKGLESKIINTCKISSLPVYVLFSGSKRVVYVSASLSDMEKEIDRNLPPKEKPKTNSTSKTKKK